MKTLVVYPNMPLQFSLPHSIAQISSLIKSKGEDVKLFDCTMYKTDEITDDEKRVKRGQVKPFKIKGIKTTDMVKDFNRCVDSYQPDTIMISFVDNTVDIGFKLLNSLENHVFTIAGGVSVILNKERFNKPLIDVAWDDTATRFLYPNTPDIMVFDDWTIFEPNRLYRPMDGINYKTVPFLTNYSCPYNCGFCCAPALRHVIKYNQKPFNMLINELEFQIELHDPEFMYFTSETFFSLPMKQLKQFAKIYKKHSLPFWCQTHVNTITEERVKLLHDMNCHKIAIGIECGNEKYRNEMIGKHFSNKQAIEAFKLLAKYGIDAAANNMIGLPLETHSQINDTINLNRELYSILPSMQLNCYIFQPFHGTKLRDMCVTYDLLLGEPDTVIGDPVIKNKYVSDEYLMNVRDNFYRMVTT